MNEEKQWRTSKYFCLFFFYWKSEGDATGCERWWRPWPPVRRRSTDWRRWRLCRCRRRRPCTRLAWWRKLRWTTFAGGAGRRRIPVRRWPRSRRRNRSPSCRPAAHFGANLLLVWRWLLTLLRPARSTPQSNHPCIVSHAVRPSISTQIVSEKWIKSNVISKNIRRIIIIHSRKFNSMCLTTTDLFSVDAPLENGHRFGRSRSAVEWHPFTWQVARLYVNNDGSLKGQICWFFWFFWGGFLEKYLFFIVSILISRKYRSPEYSCFF